MSQNNANYVRKDLPASVLKTGYLLFGIGLAFGALNMLIDFNFALYAYLTTFMVLVSIAIGCLFLVALEYVAGADWSVIFRRISEFFASLLPYLIVLALPLLLNIHTLFHWSHQDAVAGDKMLMSKSPYLNTTFFVIRVVGIFVLWSLFYFAMVRNSRKQDESKDQALTTKNIRLSAVFIPVFAITITIAAIDWMMSLEPHWYSTIFGVYYFAGTVLAALSIVTFTAVVLREKGYLHPKMVDDHYFSLGALLFAFINFWGYIAFSQYLLIWYANLPEETFWFLARWKGGWMMVSIALIIIHFIVPYSLLLSQPSKMDPKRLKLTSLWILFAHGVDCYWLIMPNLRSNEISIFNIILQFAFPTAAVGGLLILFYHNAKKHNLVPVGDPKLQKGLNIRV